MKVRAWDDFPHRDPGLSAGACDQQAVAAGDDALGDHRNLRRGFALSEYNLGHPLPHGSMVVHPGKVEVFIRRSAQSANYLGECLILWDQSLLERIEEEAQFGLGH
jgi:hypothetical protein